MQQRSQRQNVVSMQLSLLADNQDSQFLSVEGSESAFLCRSLSVNVPVHLQQQQQDSRSHTLHMSIVWNKWGGEAY